jgi:hypothetical protein
MRKTSWNSDIRLRIASVIGPTSGDGLDAVGLFGSATHSEHARDIDLLAVYDPSVIAPSEAHQLGDRLHKAFANYPLRVTIILLSRREHVSSEFARAEGAVQVWP